MKITRPSLAQTGLSRFEAGLRDTLLNVTFGRFRKSFGLTYLNVACGGLAKSRTALRAVSSVFQLPGLDQELYPNVRFSGEQQTRQELPANELKRI
jgi:hypothetical protein